MKRFILIIVVLTSVISIFGQTETEKQQAYDKAKQAIELMDLGDYENSIKLLEESSQLDPTNYIYPYEIGYAFYLKEKYKKAAKYFEQVIKMDGVNDQCYQMLGNAYSMDGDKKKAIDAYKRGLKKYPKSGRLYLEIGNVHQDDVNKALEFYEQGVRVDPAFSSNYYWLTRIFCNTTEEIWGMLYGEIFMNLERGSERTEEISKLLFDTYKSEIQFTSDTSMTVSFCQNAVIYSDNKKSELPFSMVYEPGLMFAINSDSISLQSLNNIRTQFINFYYEKDFNKSHPNVIFEWHKSLIKNNKFECYNYWLLMKGANDEFGSWHASNEEKFDSFINWFSENPMQINSKNNFHRFDY